MFGNVPWDSKMVRVWARYSDRMRANPIIAFIVSDPRIKEGTLDDFGAAIQVDPANAPPGRTFCVRADAQTPLLKGCRDDEVFFKLSSTPECRALGGHTAFDS
jgi:hypothetical protein